MIKFINYNKRFYIPAVLMILFTVISYFMLIDNMYNGKINIFRANEKQAHDISDKINEYFQNKMKFANIAGSLIFLENDSMIKDVSKKFGGINHFFITDEQGSIIYEYNSRHNQSYKGKNIYGQEEFTRGKRGAAFISELKADVISGEDTINISVPYYDEINAFKGIVCVVMHRDELMDYLSKRIDLKKDAYYALIDNNDDVFLHPNLKKAREIMKNSKFFKSQIDSLRTDKDKTVELKSEIDYEIKLFSYDKVESAPWSVIYVTKTEQAYSSLGIKFMINLNILLIIGLFIMLFTRNYLLQSKREEDFVFYNLQRIEIIAQISAGIAHEIRNPLSTVKGYIQMCHHKETSPISNIAIKDMERIENTLSQFGRLTSDLNENEGEYYPQEVIRELSTVIEGLGLVFDMELTYDIEQNMPKINFPKHYLRFIILSVIQNERKEADKQKSVQIVLKNHIQNSVCFNITKEYEEIDKNKKDLAETIKRLVKRSGGECLIETTEKNIQVKIIVPYA